MDFSEDSPDSLLVLVDGDEVVTAHGLALLGLGRGAVGLVGGHDLGRGEVDELEVHGLGRGGGGAGRGGLQVGIEKLDACGFLISNFRMILFFPQRERFTDSLLLLGIFGNT